MNEGEWLTGKNADSMLTFLGEKVSHRKLRLFACALGRRLWSRLTSDAVRHAVEFAERAADDQADPAALDSVWKGALRAVPEDRGKHAHWAAAHSASSDIRFWAGASACQAGMTGLRKAGVATLLREILGNPFRPLTLDAAHRTPAVVSLARAAYDERQMPGGELEPQRLAVLADALEEAGASTELVAHLRSPGPHFRGCHALDLCLGLG
jgi:hypothetical protein